MKFQRKDEWHIVDGEGTLILSKNEYGIKVDNLEGFNFINIHVVGKYGKFGKLRQLIKAFKFIYGK